MVGGEGQLRVVRCSIIDYLPALWRGTVPQHNRPLMACSLLTSHWREVYRMRAHIEVLLMQRNATR
jgi:hypothetical protein